MPRKRNEDALPRDKLLVLYQRLTLDGRRHYQSDIAEELGCAPQTVSRLINVIDQHLGKDAFIERELDGRRRYYRIRSKSEERSLGFSFEELRYLAMCRDLAAPYLPEGVADRINRSLTALALQLGESAVHSVQGMPIGFRSKGFIDYTPHLGTVAALRQAIDKRQVCDVTYKATGRQADAIYRYAPGRILAMSGTLYVQGYRLGEGSLLKDRPTTFSLHRISGVAPTGQYFGFNAADADARSFGLSWHAPKRVRVQFAPQAADYVRDRIWSADQTIEERDDGSIVLTVLTTGENELNAWIGGFCGLARLENPTPVDGVSQIVRTGASR